MLALSLFCKTIRHTFKTRSYVRVVRPGDSVYNDRVKSNIPAQYVLTELYVEDPWPTGETRSLRVRLWPSGLQDTRILVRVAARDRNSNLINFPSYSSLEDQQGFPVEGRVIRLLVPIPTFTRVPPTATAAPTLVPPTVVASPTNAPTLAPAVAVPTAPPAVAPTAGASSGSGSSGLLLVLMVLAVGGALGAVIVAARRHASPRTPYWPSGWPPAGGQGGRDPQINALPTQLWLGQSQPTGNRDYGAASLPAGYAIVGQPKHGGMAIVYKVYEPKLDRYVAVKVLSPALCQDQAFVSRFYEEARRTAGLEHPNIVTIYDIGEANGSAYIAMRFIEGESLQELILRFGRLPIQRATRIVAQIADALDYAHSRGVIHRDVKPANIMIEAGDRVTLTDFGIAKLVGSTQLTQTGSVIGTPAYLSPEQAVGGEVDHRSDLYSLGIVFFEMLVGLTPFRVDTSLAVLHAHVYTPPPSPASLGTNLPEPIVNVIMKSLSKDRAQRFQSGRAFVQALLQAGAGD